MPLSTAFATGTRHLGRYREVLSILFKYGFDDLLSTLEVKKYINKIIKSDGRHEQLNELTRGERVKLALNDLGTTFIKLGQFLSQRPDLVSVDLIKELEKLQDEVSPFDGNEAVKIVEDQLNCSVQEHFSYFDRKAYASASIAQVHRAILVNGEHVVVKVQRQGIEKTIQTDLEIMRGMAQLMQYYIKNMDYFNPVGIVDRFEASLKKELDFKREGANIALFRKNIPRNENVYAPKYYAEYSSKKVLTMEYLVGFKVTDLKAYKAAEINPKKIAKTALNSFFRQVLIDGYFHADPHAGNLYVDPGGRLGLLDFGQMGNLAPHNRDALIKLFIGVETKDAKRMVWALKQLSGTRFIEDEESLELRLLELVENYSMVNLSEVNISEVFGDLKNLIIDYKIKAPPDFFLLGKALSSIESICRRLYPDLNVINHFKPYVHKLVREKFTLKAFAKDLYFPLLDMRDLLKDLPGNLKDIMAKLNVGSMKIDIEHWGLHEFKNTLEKVSNRISLSILIASMLIGSSLIVLANIPPFVYNIPLLGVIGFVLAVIMAFWLVISIIRGGNT